MIKQVKKEALMGKVKFAVRRCGFVYQVWKESPVSERCNVSEVKLELYGSFPGCLLDGGVWTRVCGFSVR